MSSITNISKPTTALTNSSKISHEETWASNTSTWATETRTWNETGSKITNSSLGVAGFLWSIKRFPWTELTPWLSEGGITNTNKPA